MKKILKKLVPNQILEKYRQAKSELQEAKGKIIANIIDDERNSKGKTEENEEESEVKKGKKFSNLFSAGLAITGVAIGIVSITGGLAAPFVLAALALEIVAATFDIYRVIKGMRKERKNNQKEKNKDEENSLATQETLSDTMSQSSDLSPTIQDDKSHPSHLLDKLKGGKQTKKLLKRTSRRNQKNGTGRNNNNNNGPRLSFPFRATN